MSIDRDPEELAVEATANEIVTPHGLRAEVLPGVRSVGVGGDFRLYRPVVELVGPFPGWDVIAELSTAISNRTQGCRVTYRLATTP